MIFLAQDGSCLVFAGELHRYTADQMLEEFGVDQVQPGMEIEHKTRGRAFVLMGIIDVWKCMWL